MRSLSEWGAPTARLLSGLHAKQARSPGGRRDRRCLFGFSESAGTLLTRSETRIGAGGPLTE
jgi:hypothetical protein